MADYAADVAVRCGLSLAAAAEHSLPALRLLDAAARRRDAEREVMMAQIVYTSAAAAFTGEKAGRAWEKLVTQLQKETQHGLQQDQR